MLVGATIGLTLVLAERILGSALFPHKLVKAMEPVGGLWPILFGTPLALAALTAGIASTLRRSSALAAASELDHTLRLHDRLATALSIADSTEASANPFAQIACADADLVASTVHIKNAFPLRPGRTWVWWPTISMAACGIGIFGPSWGLLDPADAAVKHNEEAQRESAIDQVEEASTAVQDEIKQALGATALADRHSEAVDQIKKELEAGTEDADVARLKAADDIARLADTLEKEGAAAAAADDLLRNRLSAIEPSQAQGESALSQALRSGDLSEARRAAEELLKTAPELTLAERQKIADELEELAEAIEKQNGGAQKPDSAQADGSSEPARSPSTDGRSEDEPADSTSGRAPAPENNDGQSSQDASNAAQGGKPAEPQQPPPVTNEPEDESLRKDLRDQGLNEAQVEEAMKQPDADAAAKDLQDKGVRDDTARRLGERIAERNRAVEALTTSDENAKELSEGLKDAAESLREDTPTDRSGDPDAEKNESDPAQQEPADKSSGEQKHKPTKDDGAPEDGDKPPTDGKPNAHDGAEQSENGTGESNSTQQSKERGTREMPGSKRDSTPGIKPMPAKPDGEKANPKDPAKPTDGKSEKSEPSDSSEQNSSESQPADGKDPEAGETEGGTPPQNSDQPANGSKSGGDQPKDGQDGQTSQQGGAGEGQNSSDQDQGGSGDKTSQDGKGKGGDPSSGSHEQGEQDAGDKDAQGGTKATSDSRDDTRTDGEGQGQGGSGSGAGRGQGRSGLQSLTDKLRDLDEQRSRGENAQQAAQRIREEARKLLDNLSPEERQELERWSRDLAKEASATDSAPDGYETTDVDARGRNEGATEERVVAEWLGEGQKGDPSARAEAQEVIRAAQRSAETAVESGAIPRRYDAFLQRYFKRLPDRLLPPAKAKPASGNDTGKVEPKDGAKDPASSGGT